MILMINEGPIIKHSAYYGENEISANKASLSILNKVLAHTEPICKVHRLLKLPDMFSIALWKFYHKLMNNQLPACFSTLKPRLSEIVEHYEIRNPVFHLPAIKHKFAENSLQYCLIKLINEEHSFSMMSDMMERTSFYSFKVFIKHRVLDTYKISRCDKYKCVHAILMLIHIYIHIALFVFSLHRVYKTTICLITIMFYFSVFVLVVL